MSGAYPLCPLLSHLTPAPLSCSFRYPPHHVCFSCRLPPRSDRASCSQRLHGPCDDNRADFSCRQSAPQSKKALAAFSCMPAWFLTVPYILRPDSRSRHISSHTDMRYRFLPGCFFPLVSAVHWLFCNFSHYAWVFPCNCLDFPPYLHSLKSAVLITCRMYYINTHDYLYSAIRLKRLLSHIYMSFRLLPSHS